MVDPPPPLPPLPPGGFIRDGVTYDSEGDALPELAVQDEDDEKSLCPPVAGTAGIVTDEKAPCSPPGMSLKDPILAAAYGGRPSVKDILLTLVCQVFWALEGKLREIILWSGMVHIKISVFSRRTQ